MQKEVFVLDSNIWISYLITRRLSTLVAVIQQNQMTVLTNQHLIDEMREVLTRAKFRKYIIIADIKEFIAIHIKLCQYSETGGAINKLTDIKDNFLLSLYDTGKATLLVSGDKELLKEATEHDYNVMTLREFELSFALRNP